MNVKREITDHFLYLLSKYPVVTINGPRQSGKTTLVKAVCKNKPYFNMESPTDRASISTDPDAFLRRYPDGAIIDEIQKTPDLLSYIQVHVDQFNKKGMFILTGSLQFELNNKISQSLAGRTGLLRLLPFSIQEATKIQGITSIDQMLHTGFYPRILKEKINPEIGYADYFETYVQKDIRQLSEIRNLSLFETFVKLCAGRTGQILNLQNLSSDLGVSVPTIRSWLSLLEASYIVYMLQPLSAKGSKQLIKSPKIYFHDVGLASFLIGIENQKQVFTHPLRGQLFENLVINEALKCLYNQGKRPKFNFCRDNKGKEIDLVITKDTDLIAIEIKASETYSSDFSKNIAYFENSLGNKIKKKVVVYGGKSQGKISDAQIVNYSELSEFLRGLFRT